MQIFKFGGVSLKNAKSIIQVSDIIKKHKDEHLVIVVSAMDKTTNALELVHSYFISNNEKKYDVLSNIKQFHFNILQELFNPEDEVFYEVEKLFFELNNYISLPNIKNIDYEYDQIVSFGEILSSIIIYNYLRRIDIDVKWIDIRKQLITDEYYKEASILFEKSLHKIKSVFSSKGLYICQGFIGGTENGASTTLGREGSDYTAAALAYMLDAEQVTIWKDVPGVLNADPRIMPDAIKLDAISYKEAIELAYYGAQVIHHKTIKPLQNKNIPLYVKPYTNPDSSGTIVMNIDKTIDLPPIYIYKYNQVLISVMPKDFSFIVEENLSIIFKILAELKIKVNLMQQSAISFTICIDFNEQKLNNLLKALNNHFDALHNTNLTLVTIRHYTNEALEKVIGNNKIIIKEISRKTARVVLKQN
jgi:aspartate kinase